MVTGNRPGGTDPVRTAVRFPIRLTLRIKTPEGEIEATTENISANGMLFTAERVPPVDSRIEFTMIMPAAVMGAVHDLPIQCTGRIVRHQRVGDELQAAAIIDEYMLRA